MSCSPFRDQLDNSDNVFLKMPHIFKPLQTLNAVILAICIGSTAGPENGILWFVVILSFLISAAATVVFALGVQDVLMNSLTNGGVAWNVVEMVYSFILGVLSVICVWLSFGFANRNMGGTSAGYIASGLFSIIQIAFYAVPCVMIYDSIQNGVRSEQEAIIVQSAHPFHDAPYQDL